MAGITCGYHLSAKVVSRGKGQSAIAKAAYNSRDKIRDEKTGELKDYTRREGIVFSGIFAPKDGPEWAQDRGQLWNAVELKENRSNSQLAREIELAFPDGLTQQGREWLIKDFAREQFARKGYAADVNIHAPGKDGDERNFHAHVLVPLRPFEGEEFAHYKGGQFRDFKEWMQFEKDQLEGWREKWAEMGAKALDRQGLHVEAERWRHGHETLDQQRTAALGREDYEFAVSISREATRHLGPTVYGMERRGVETLRAQEWREQNRELPAEALSKALNGASLDELKDLQQQLKDTLHEIRVQLAGNTINGDEKAALRGTREERLDEFRAVNFEIGQRHRADRVAGKEPEREKTVSERVDDAKENLKAAGRGASNTLTAAKGSAGAFFEKAAQVGEIGAKIVLAPFAAGAESISPTRYTKDQIGHIAALQVAQEERQEHRADQAQDEKEYKRKIDEQEQQRLEREMEESERKRAGRDR